MGPSSLLRPLVVLLVDAVALLLLSEVLPGFTLDGPGAALVTAALIGLLNAFVWPVLARLALPLSVLTLGLAGLALNALLVTVAIDLVPDARLEGFWTGLLVTLGMAVLTALLSGLLAIGDDQSWYRNVVRFQTRRRGERIETDVPGIAFLEIDGLAQDVLRRAMRDGNAPAMAAWVRTGSHRLDGWETDWSSQTGACQAGLLHGNNHDMPAFRWWEKDTGRPIVTNHPRDAAELERRRSDGRGLLHEDGASRANILSGDAVHSMLTMSTVLNRRRPIGRDYSAYFARPYAVAKTLAGVVADVARERHARAQQHRRDVQPRIHRSRQYAALRAFATVIQLDLQIAAVVGDMLSGRPVIYTTFLAYDEVAHHSGIERPDALAVLSKVDREIARLAVAAEAAPRPYRLVVLADHGQSQGATFLQRYGVTLETLVRTACEAKNVHVDTGREDDAASYLGAGLTELARDDTVAARAARRARPAAALEPGDGDGADAAARAVGHGLGQPRPDHLPARARPGHARAPRSAPPRGCCRRCATTRASPSSWCAPSATARWPSGREGVHHLADGARRGRGPARRLRAEHRRAPAPHRRLPALPGRDGQQRLLGGHRRGGRLRGAGRLPRRPGRHAVAPVRAPSRRPAVAGGARDRRRAGAPDHVRLARLARASGIRPRAVAVARAIVNLIEFALRCARRFVEIEGAQLATVLSAQAFTSLIPFLVVASSVGPRSESLADRMIERFELRGDLADSVRALFNDVGEVNSTVTWIGVVILVLATLSFTRALQRSFQRAYGQPARRVADGWRGLAWLAGFALWISVSAPLREEIDDAGGIVIAITAGTAVGFAVWLWTPMILLGREDWKRLVPGAIVSGVLGALLSVASSVYVPILMTWSARKYGLIGVAFSLQSWLLVYAFMVIIAAVIGAIASEVRAIRPRV